MSIFTYKLEQNILKVASINLKDNKILKHKGLLVGSVTVKKRKWRENLTKTKLIEGKVEVGEKRKREVITQALNDVTLEIDKGNK